MKTLILALAVMGTSLQAEEATQLKVDMVSMQQEGYKFCAPEHYKQIIVNSTKTGETTIVCKDGRRKTYSQGKIQTGKDADLSFTVNHRCGKDK